MGIQGGVAQESRDQIVVGSSTGQLPHHTEPAPPPSHGGDSSPLSGHAVLQASGSRLRGGTVGLVGGLQRGVKGGPTPGSCWGDHGLHFSQQAQPN